MVGVSNNQFHTVDAILVTNNIGLPCQFGILLVEVHFDG